MAVMYGRELEYASVHEWTKALFARSTELTTRLAGACSVAEASRRRAWEVRLRSRATRDQAESLRQKFADGFLHGAPDPGVRWFTLEGTLGDQTVWARWAGGRLRCHPSLLTQARLVVELGTVFEHHDPPARVHATITGVPAAVMLTLARACDRVIAVDFSRQSPL